MISICAPVLSSEFGPSIQTGRLLLKHQEQPVESALPAAVVTDGGKMSSKQRPKRESKESVQADTGNLPHYDLNAPDGDVLSQENLAEAGAGRVRKELNEHNSTSPELTGGDVDADWQAAANTGEEAVGGHAPTPDQNVVDSIGRALGVDEEDEGELRTSEELLSERDENRWELDRRSADEEEQELQKP